MRPTAIACDEDLIADVEDEPTVTNVYTGHYPPDIQAPGIPAGYQAGFLMRSKDFVRG